MAADRMDVHMFMIVIVTMVIVLVVSMAWHGQRTLPTELYHNIMVSH